MIEEIIVTAQKREESISEVPITISAFSGETLRALGVTDTRDLGNLVTGFNVANTGFNTPVYTLRGVGFNEASQTASSTVGVYLDEINLPFPTMTRGANLDLERIEVLKGPQGTLYGRNTTGGAVNYIARKPTSELSYGFSGAYSRFDTAELEGYVSGPLTRSGTLLARLAYKTLQSGEGWQFSKTRSPDGPYDTLGRQDRQAGRVSLEWQAQPELSFVFGVDGWTDRSEPQAAQVIAIRAQNPFFGELALDPEVRDYPVEPFGTDRSRAADWPFEFRYTDEVPRFRLADSFIMGSLRADWAFSDDAALTLLAAHQRYEADGSFIPQSGLNTVNSERELFTTIDASAAELRLSGNWRDLAQWQLGVNAARDDVTDTQEFRHETVSAIFPIPVGLPGILSELFGDTLMLNPLIAERSGFDGGQLADIHAVFGQVDWTLSDHWSLTTGLRYTREKRKFNGCGTSSEEATQGVGLPVLFNAMSIGLYGGTGGAEPGGCVTINTESGNPERFFGTLDEDNLGGRLALTWTPADGLLYFLSYSRGFKSGSFPSINISTSDQFAPVVQEQLDAYELGAKMTMLDRRLQLNPALFYYDYKDKQLLTRTLDPVFGPLPILDNAPKSEVLGAELELQATPVAPLFLSLAVSWLDTEVKEFVSGGSDGRDFDFAGLAFNYTSEWSYTALANYTIPIAASLDLSLGIDYSYRSATNATLDRDPLFEIPDYDIINARIGVQSANSRWSLTAFGRNLSDTYYVTNVVSPTDSVARYTGMPRTFGLTFTYRGEEP